MCRDIFLPFITLWPAGCGNTTIAKIIAAEKSACSRRIYLAVLSGVAELKKKF
jgi:replication-associated recombination protein RarA